MILRGDWQEQVFTAADAMHFDLGGLRGWNRADHEIPEGAVETGVEPGGWDHEHCEICRAVIGARGSPVRYVDPMTNRYVLRVTSSTRTAQSRFSCGMNASAVAEEVQSADFIRDAINDSPLSLS